MDRHEESKNGEEREESRGSIIAGGLMRRHNCTIIDERFIRRADPRMELRALSKTLHTEDTAARIAYYYEENERCFSGRDRGMSGWPKMTITEDAVKCTLPAARGRRFENTRNAILSSLQYYCIKVFRTIRKLKW